MSKYDKLSSQYFQGDHRKSMVHESRVIMLLRA